MLANVLATGAALVALILALGPISGAHFNPWVSLAAASQGDLKSGDAGAYTLVQLGGAVVGVGMADAMFGLSAYSWSEYVRTGLPRVASEAVATFRLLVVIACCRDRLTHAAIAVGAYITAASWFTPSTSFANPAVTLARAGTNTFAGIRPADVLPFLLGQAMGAGAAIPSRRVRRIENGTFWRPSKRGVPDEQAGP